MRTMLLAATALVGLAIAPAHATLMITATDNGNPITLTGCVPSNPSGTGGISCGSNDPTFSQFQITAAGDPSLPAPDLSSETIQVTAGAIATSHTLAIDIAQTAITAPPGALESTFTVNNLIGNATIGSTTETTQVNGATLNSETFAAGTITETRVDAGSVLLPITSDDHLYSITFNAAGESVNDTIQTEALPVSEPATLTLLGMGLLTLGFVRRRRS